MNEEKQKTDALEDALLAVSKALGIIRMEYPMHPVEALNVEAESVISELIQSRRKIIKLLDEQSGKGK